MIDYLPGTVLKYSEEVADNCYSVIEPLFAVTKGLTLSQVCDITGLKATTIQNWLRRGWVKNPENKRYVEQQVIRIILINTMCSSMELQQIAFLLEYINGEVSDTSDDILPDFELYNVLCRIVINSEKIPAEDEKLLDTLITDSVHGVKLQTEEAEEKLKTALRAMALAIIAGRIRKLAIDAYNDLV